MWLDESRDRMRLVLAYAAAANTARLAGAKRSALPDFTDPADAFAEAEQARPPSREDRAAQITAFIAANGGETGG